MAQELAGTKILVTSGPTRGAIDAVRYLSNRSSGRLGALIAQEALRAGAEVTFIFGQDSLLPQVAPAENSRLKTIAVETVSDLSSAVEEELGRSRFEAVIHAMAVLDYEPEQVSMEKVPSLSEEWWIKLVKTPKIIKLIRKLATETILVGFKLEVGKTRDELVRIAYNSLQENRADFVLANDLRDIEEGKHTGYLVNRQGEVEWVLVGKEEIARGLIHHLARVLAEKKRGGG
ncbi:MAG: hypothetical protein HYX86_04800 [Chloroflexi bacterium]|nr:hypothetical protein [Chloroflexota bacterium]